MTDADPAGRVQDPGLTAPRYSIIICTDGRPAALANTLHCLQFLDGPDFEVIVVRGPTEDGVEDVLAQWAGRIKVARNPQRNLSVSRNMGLALATGDIVAYVDDDGLPEPAWLIDLDRAFADPRVGAAGGIVMDHTGTTPQYLYAAADRLGNAEWDRTTPADAYNFPFSFNFPYIQGTNSAFRRAALLAIGGFDEEFDFYLDETDVCCRLNDAGWLIRQLPDAVVHHKFLPSAIRSADRVTRLFYSVLKNKLYFSLINNRGHVPQLRAVEDFLKFVAMQEGGLRHHHAAGRIPASDIDQFRTDVERAWAVGHERGLSGGRRLMAPPAAPPPAPGVVFRLPLPAGGRCVFAFISQEFPPHHMGGIGRYVDQLSRAIAAAGHHVHVLTGSDTHDRVDFEAGVWVHRTTVKHGDTGPPDGVAVPPHIWAKASSANAELRRLGQRQQITAAYAPIWDCEGIAMLLDGQVPLVLGLQTTLRFWLDSQPQFAQDQTFMRDFATPMLALETRLLNQADGVHAISNAIGRDISAAYGVALDPARTSIVPLGLEDWSGLPRTMPKPLPAGSLRVLFVGRLESRKGIDKLLEVAARLAERHPHLHFDIVGNDRLPGPKGMTHRAVFEAAASADAKSRILFHGEVGEAELRGFYAACDIFAAPSRFESFGLILVEAMMFAKPSIACRVGGMVEVAAEGKTALLAEPGDAVSLEACLEALIGDAVLRKVMGEAARIRYETTFAAAPMAEGVVALLRRARAGTAATPFAEA